MVIDGLQSKEEWDLIQSSLVSRYSKSNTIIIVITTEASIAAYCADKDDLVFNVKTLETDAAFDLFENEVHTFLQHRSEVIELYTFYVYMSLLLLQ